MSHGVLRGNTVPSKVAFNCFLCHWESLVLIKKVANTNFYYNNGWVWIWKKSLLTDATRQGSMWAAEHFKSYLLYKSLIFKEKRNAKYFIELTFLTFHCLSQSFKGFIKPWFIFNTHHAFLVSFCFLLFSLHKMRNITGFHFLLYQDISQLLGILLL